MTNIVDSETHFIQFKLDELENQTELFRLDSQNCFTLPFLLAAFSLPNYEEVNNLELTLPKIVSNHFKEHLDKIQALIDKNNDEVTELYKEKD